MGAPLQKKVQWFKTMSTNDYIHGVKEYGWRPFKGQFVATEFHDHVIRNEESLNRIREYVQTNPRRWEWTGKIPGLTEKTNFDRWLAAFKARPVNADRRGGPVCPPADPRRQLGDYGEDLAAAALKQAGL